MIFVHPRYALDVNVERAEDVLTHKKLLHLARDPSNRPVFEVRVVQVSEFIAVFAFPGLCHQCCVTCNPALGY